LAVAEGNKTALTEFAEEVRRTPGLGEAIGPDDQ
jgi:hypothetical protein